MVASDRMEKLPNSLKRSMGNLGTCVGSIDVCNADALRVLFREHADEFTTVWNLAAPLSVETPAVGAKLVSGGKDVGKLVAVSPESTAAVADVKLDFALSGEVLDVRVEGRDVRAAPYVPPWWPEDEEES